MKELPLNALHEKYGASFSSVQGCSIPANYGDIQAELIAANTKVVLLDRSYLGKIALRGADSLDLLNRITTNDLQQLAVGAVCDTVFVTPKGRLIDYCRVMNAGDHYLMIGSFFKADHLIEWINRFIILEDVEVMNVTKKYAWFTLLGPHAPQFVSHLHHSPLHPEEEIVWLELENIKFPAMTNNYFKVDAFNFCIENEFAGKVLPILNDTLKQFEGTLIGNTAFQIMRVESGMPDWGTEITQDYNPHEARLVNALSFTKGCYTGQEVIARLDTYDKVQKYLMIIELQHMIEEAPPLEVYIDDEHIGHLTSYVFDPIDRRSIGLGYIKKMYTMDNDIYVEVLTNEKRVPAKLRKPPQAYQ